MKKIVLMLVLFSSAAFAQKGDLACELGGIIVQGSLIGKSLVVNQANDFAGEDLNENPIEGRIIKNKLVFELSTVDSAGDSGSRMTFAMPASPKAGKFNASIRVVEVDMGGEQQAKTKSGTCSLK